MKMLFFVVLSIVIKQSYCFFLNRSLFLVTIYAFVISFSKAKYFFGAL